MIYHDSDKIIFFLLSQKEPRETPRSPQHNQQSSSSPIKPVQQTDIEQLPSILFQKPVSPVVIKHSVILPPQNLPTNNPIPTKITANDFMRAPMVQLNYVAKPSDEKSGNMTIMHRTSSHSIFHGNRWYNHDYNTKSDH